ncbi:MAG: nucleoside hydrolase, partial [Desulfobacterales bacterium]|nr:nucleoside hydrolase [Desulfobacterales bacterium]
TNMSMGAYPPSECLCNVDDAFGILHLFNAASVQVEGISTVFGNSDVETALAQTRSLDNRFGPIGLPVVKGAAAAMDIHQLVETDATKALARALEARRLTLVALGPATNIASFVLLYPELVPRIDQIILAAGRSSDACHFIAGPRQDTPFTDLNFDLDPDAVRILLESDIPLVLMPFETAHNVWVTQKELDTLGRSPGVGTFLEEYSRPWYDHWVESYGAKGFNLFAALAAGFAANPNLFKASRIPARIKICPDDTRTGRFGEPESYKPFLLASAQSVSPKKVLFCQDVAPGFARDLVSRIVNPKDMSKLVSAVSHLNVVVDDLDEATAFYRRTLGFEPAYNEDGKMDYPNLTLTSFAKDAGFLEGKVDVDIRFLHHPVAGLYLELMRYHYPKGDPDITIKNTNDMGGIRHAALEVTDVQAVFDYLKDQPGVTMVRYPNNKTKDEETGPPMTLDPFPMAFFYWRDPYGVQWEMEGGRKRGYLRGI